MPGLRLGPRLARLVREARGASVIELALFAPILAVMVMGISDVAMGYSRKLTLEQAAYRALERVAVGSVQSDYTYLRGEVAAAAGVPESSVTVDSWLECDSMRQAEFSGSCPDGQMISRYVRIGIAGSYRPSFGAGPLARRLGGTDGNVPITVSTALRIQ
jgi:Flp pilus assembly pilin Flp